MTTLKVGSTVHILVPWNSVYDASAISNDLLRDLKLENHPAVFIPVNRG